MTTDTDGASEGHTERDPAQALEAALIAAAKEVVAARHALAAERAQHEASAAQWAQLSDALQSARDGRASERGREDAALAQNALLTRAAPDAREETESTRGRLQKAIDHATEIAFEGTVARSLSIAKGRVVADVAHVENHPAKISTPAGTIDVRGTKLVVTAAP